MYFGQQLATKCKYVVTFMTEKCTLKTEMKKKLQHFRERPHKEVNCRNNMGGRL